MSSPTPLPPSAISALFAMRSTPQTVAASYTAVPLTGLFDPTPSGFGKSNGLSLNESGVVVGRSKDLNSFSRACRWVFNAPLDLGSFGGPRSEATAINEAGIICGSADLANGIPQAALWRRGLIRNLGSLAGTGAESRALAITEGEDPIVYGYSQGAQGMYRAVQWASLQIDPLPDGANWANSEARTVGWNGLPAGVAVRNDASKVCIWWNGQPVECPGLPGYWNCEPRHGQPNGYVVGFSDRGQNTETEAVLFSPALAATSLQNLPGALSSSANGVNANGVVVGEVRTASVPADGFICPAMTGGQMVSLTGRLVPSPYVATVSRVWAINDDGVMTGDGLDSNQQPVAFLLIPN